MPEYEFDPKDPAFLFGQLVTEVKNLTKSTDAMRSQMAELPCVVHKQSLADLMEWRNRWDEEQEFRNRESHKAKTSLKVGIIIAGVSAVISAGVSLAVGLLRAGPRSF